jgi:3-hydroxyisobutyrate dehydrogenase
MQVSFVGLGAMGWHCASHLVTVSSSPLRVWNRTESVATRHASVFGSTTADLRGAFEADSESEVIFTCLPDSDRLY